MSSTFVGDVYRPGDAAYDDHRKALRPDLDPHPALIVRASGVSDVRTAVAYAHEHDIPFAVQATGHGTHTAADGALLLRTGDMASVLVDPARRIAKVGPGARWGAVLAAAKPFGLAPLSGSSADVGVTGYTLGGGVGWLSRRFGLAADSVVRADVVTADGRLITASEDQYPDLFWALRGGGGNFGVVTSLEFRLYDIPQVWAGYAYFAPDGFLERYRDFALAQPDSVSTAGLLRRLPDGSSVGMLKVMSSTGPVSLSCFGSPRELAMGTMPYADAAMGGTAARFMDYFRTLPDATPADLHDEHAATGSTVEVRHWAGAIATGKGPAGHRDAEFSVILDAPSATFADRVTGMGAKFLNFLADPSRVREAYAADAWRRLATVKAFYDPENFFRINHNIAPAGTTKPSAVPGRGRRRLPAAA
jgi:FAD binding domain-containing protein/berberine-like enzyme